MTNEELFRIVIKPKIALVKEEVQDIAKLCKLWECTNKQEVIDYENFLNEYSNIDYNKI